MRFDVSGTLYRAWPLDARAQFALLRRLMPILPALDSVGRFLSSRGKTDPAAAFAAIAPLATASEDDVAFVVDAAPPASKWSAERGAEPSTAPTISISPRPCRSSPTWWR